MPFIVRAFPVLEGMEESVRELGRAMMGERGEQTADFYCRHGVRHESWHIQDTVAGLWVIAVSDIDAPEERAREYSESQVDFDRWFKDRVLELTGIDPQTQPLGPPTEQIFTWSAMQER